jgi:hypothetical protein
MWRRVRPMANPYPNGPTQVQPAKTNPTGIIGGTKDERRTRQNDRWNRRTSVRDSPPVSTTDPAHVTPAADLILPNGARWGMVGPTRQLPLSQGGGSTTPPTTSPVHPADIRRRGRSKNVPHQRDPNRRGGQNQTKPHCHDVTHPHPCPTANNANSCRPAMGANRWATTSAIARMAEPDHKAGPHQDLPRRRQRPGLPQQIARGLDPRHSLEATGNA